MIADREKRKYIPINIKFSLLNKNDNPERCPVCRNRLDGITKVSPEWIGEKLDLFIAFLKKDKKRFKDLNKAKFNFINQMLDNNIKRN